MPSLRALLRRAVHRSRRGHPARQAAGPLPLHARPSAGQDRRARSRASRCSSRPSPSGDLFLAGLRRLEADLGVVVAYGHILRPRGARRCPARGMINVHASLLPRFRGAAPIQHAILAGDRETGISIMRMEEGLDSGPVLHRSATPIGDGETAGSLTPRLAELGADGAGGGALAPLGGIDHARSRRTRAGATYAPKIDPGDGAPRLEPRVGRRSSARSAPSIRRRAPGRRSMGRRSSCSARMPAVGSGEPGTVLAARDRLVIAGGSGAIAVREVAARGAEPPRRGGLGARPRHRGREPVRVRPLAPAARRHRRGRARGRRFRRPRGRDRRGRAGGGAARARPDAPAARRSRAWRAGCWRWRARRRRRSFVNGRPDVAAALGAQGVQLGARRPARRPRRAPPFPHGWIGRSVHSAAEAEAAVARGRRLPAGGQRLPDATHPGRPGQGLGLVRDAARLGLPVIAIGGIDAARAAAVREAGAYGVAAIAALWWAPDPAAAALALLAPWSGGA